MLILNPDYCKVWKGGNWPKVIYLVKRPSVWSIKHTIPTKIQIMMPTEKVLNRNKPTNMLLNQCLKRKKCLNNTKRMKKSTNFRKNKQNRRQLHSSKNVNPSINKSKKEG